MYTPFYIKFLCYYVEKENLTGVNRKISFCIICLMLLCRDLSYKSGYS